MAGRGLIGKLGSVVIRIRGGDLPGEVRVVVGGLPHYYLAYCPQPVPVGVEVLIVATRGARRVDVEPWADWADIGPEVDTGRGGPTEAM